MNPHHVVTRPAKWEIPPIVDPPMAGLLTKGGHLFVRLASGIAEHFVIRVGEWIMTYAMIGFAWSLWLVPNSFSINPSFIQIARVADEGTWAAIMVTAGFFRLIALFINGTFRHRFKYSPHLRGLAALVACFIWGQITLGTLLSYFYDGGILAGFVAYGALMLQDMWNLFRSWADVGHHRIDPA